MKNQFVAVKLIANSLTASRFLKHSVSFPKFSFLRIQKEMFLFPNRVNIVQLLKQILTNCACTEVTVKNAIAIINFTVSFSDIKSVLTV